MKIFKRVAMGGVLLVLGMNTNAVLASEEILDLTEVQKNINAVRDRHVEFLRKDNFNAEEYLLCAFCFMSIQNSLEPFDSTYGSHPELISFRNSVSFAPKIYDPSLGDQSMKNTVIQNIKMLKKVSLEMDIVRKAKTVEEATAAYNVFCNDLPR